MAKHNEILALALAAYIIFSIAGIAMLLHRGSNEILGKATSSSGTVSITITGTTTTQCNDGTDNDGDKLTDYGGRSTNDPGCSSSTDNNERDDPSTEGRVVIKGKEGRDIPVDKNALDITFQAGFLKDYIIMLTNFGDEEKTYAATLYGLDGVIRLRETSFTMPGNSKYELVLELIGDVPGTYTGKLILQSDRELRIYTITAVVQDGPSRGKIFETYYPVEYSVTCPGCYIGFTLMLNNLIEPALATYSIMDYQNNVIYRENDIIQPEERQYSKTIKVPESTQEGEYVLFIAVNSDGTTDVTTHRFEVRLPELREEKASSTTKLGIVLLLIGLIISNALLIKTKPKK